MAYLLALEPDWHPVYTLEAGAILGPGRPAVAALLAEAARITDPFLCYAWSTGNQIRYCGSISRNWKYARGKSNLYGRVHAYLYHQGPTNVRVRDHIMKKLPTQAVTFSILRFPALRFGDTLIDQDTFSHTARLVLAVEQLLICSYQDAGHQCDWNLTGIVRDA